MDHYSGAVPSIWKFILFTEIATPEIGPITVAAARLVVGGAVLAALMSAGPAKKMPTLSQMALLGMFNSFLPITLIAWPSMN